MNEIGQLNKAQLAQLKEVDRAIEASASKQPRFTDTKDTFYSAIINWVKYAVNEWAEPDYQADSRKRDAWLREVWRREPHWSGIINQTVLVDSGRGWSLTGGRNQVRRYTEILHQADGGQGWRHFFRRTSLSYRVTDIGSLTEVGRDGIGGPLRAVFHLDSARCRWTGNVQEPLLYKPCRGKVQHWKPKDFFNVASLPSDDEAFHGLGWCMTSRAFELVKLLYGVLAHDQEAVGAKMPRGLLLLHGITEEQWGQAMAARNAELSAQERKYFGSVFVLASQGVEEVEAKLVALSNLPSNFDRQDFLDAVMYGYALVAGYDPREFWPVSGGQLGTATETETQHQKASTKGALEFPHAFQERLQKELPATLHFEFDERSDEGELLAAQVATAWLGVAEKLSQADPISGLSLLPREQVLSFLIDRGVLPPEATEFEEESQATDEEAVRLKRLRRRALDNPNVRRAAETFPADAIVRSIWDGTRQTELVLWHSGQEALRPRVWAVKRQEDEVLYESDDVIITQADVDRSVEQAGRRVDDEFAELLTAEVVE